jgi:hypothetical protein
MAKKRAKRKSRKKQLTDSAELVGKAKKKKGSIDYPFVGKNPDKPRL